MKIYAILAALIASPAFAHMIEPETKFFKDELNKNPEIAQVLQYCKLRGLSSEEACKSEMYVGDSISQLKVEAAGKCLSASGYRYRAALDSFFKVDIRKATLASDEMLGGFWHTFYRNAPGDPKGTAPHRHDWSDDARQLGGDRAGIEAVKSFKERMARDGISYTDSLSGTSSGTLGGGLVPGSATGSMTKSGSTTTTRATYSKKEMDESYKSGFASGYANPGNWGVKPDIACFEKGDCFDNAHGGKFPNPDYTPKGTGVAKESSIPKPLAPKEEPNPQPPTVAPDPFAPFLSPSDSTGGVKTSNDPKTKVEEKKAKNEKDGVTTPIDDEKFALDWNDCIQIIERELIEQKGQQTADHEAKTKEEKQAEAEELLKQGLCDRGFYTETFCHNFEDVNARTEDEGAEAGKKAEYDEAITELQSRGVCNERVLGYAFCKAYQDELNSTKLDGTLPTLGVGETLKSPETPISEGLPEGTSSWGDPASGQTPASNCERDMFGDCKT